MFIPDVLIKNADEIRKLRPDKQVIEIDRDAWNHEDLDIDLDEILGPGNSGLSRNRVLDMAPILDPYRLVPCDQAFPDLRRLFITVMVWGFGRTGYGPYRVAAMLRAPNLQPTLCAATRAIAFGMYGAAYDILRATRIPQLGPSFASKYLYFCSARSTYSIIALIFDARVASGLRRSDFPPDFWRYLTCNNSATDSSVLWTASGYLQYLILMHCWASALRCSATQLELFLFTHGNEAPNNKS